MSPRLSVLLLLALVASTVLVQTGTVVTFTNPNVRKNNKYLFLTVLSCGRTFDLCSSNGDCCVGYACAPDQGWCRNVRGGMKRMDLEQ